MELKVNKNCDSKYNIRWVLAHCKTCFIDYNYKDMHEPTVWGCSISVKLPDSDNSYAEFAINDEGWMYVSDRFIDGLDEITIDEGINAVEENLKKSELLNSHFVITGISA